MQHTSGRFIPTTVGEITVDWLHQVLGRFGTIRQLRAESLGEGVGILGQLARLHLDYVPGTTGPATMIAKCPSPAPENQHLARAMGFYLREVSFYREVAASLTVRVPHAYHADAADDGLPFVLLLEDIVGARTPDQIAGITPDEAARILNLCAELHAAFWDSPRLAEMTWLPPMNNPLYRAGEEMAMARLSAFVERFGERIGDEMVAVVTAVCQHYVELLDHVAAKDHLTFTHTDCRAENYLFGGSAGDDALTMIDFQISTRHFGPWDVANLLGGSMAPDARREVEDDLLAGYHAELIARGVEGYTLDRCWDDYRMSLLQMCSAAVIVSDLQGGNERGDDLLENLFLRPVLAARDHRVGELLPRFCS
jgi:aminoglycoside/choline kinase family phosphotransferase